MKNRNIPKLRFKGFHNKWMKVQLKNICSSKRSKHSMKDAKNSPKGKHPIFDVSNHIIKRIKDYDMTKDYIAITKDGYVGRITKHPANTSVINTMTYIIPKNKISYEFLYMLLRTINFNKYKVGTSIQHIYFKDYSQNTVNVPTLREQRQISQQFSLLEHLSQLQQKKAMLLKKLTKAYLQKMFPI